MVASVSNVAKLRRAPKRTGVPRIDFAAFASRFQGLGQDEFSGGEAFSAEVLKVLGDDTRRVELGTLNPPWLHICSLEIRRAQAVSYGTGWLAGPALVVTAGHCLFDPTKGWADSVSVIPARRGNVAPFGTFVGTQFSAAEPWIASRAIDFDLGCVHLDERLGDTLGWLPFEADTPSNTDEVTVAGYPEFAGSHKHLLVGHGRATASQGQLLFYDVDTDEGQSGSPVWRKVPTGDDPVVVAVHTYEPKGTPQGTALNANSATLLTDNLVELLMSWDQSE